MKQPHIFQQGMDPSEGQSHPNSQEFTESDLQRVFCWTEELKHQLRAPPEVSGVNYCCH